MFETEIAEEFGLQDHPKKDLLMSICYDKAGGITIDTFYEYELLSELLS